MKSGHYGRTPTRREIVDCLRNFAAKIKVPRLRAAMIGGAVVITASLVGVPKNALSASEGALLTACTFDPDILKSALTAGDSNVDKSTWVISYVVIYNRENPFSGQVIETGPDSGGFTGPILCVDQTAEDVAPDAESVSIPDTTLNHPGIESIDILENQEALIMRYELNDNDGTSPLDGDVENRVCHTSGTEIHCALVRQKP